jgi:hypothetical protein
VRVILDDDEVSSNKDEPLHRRLWSSSTIGRSSGPASAMTDVTPVGKAATDKEAMDKRVAEEAAVKDATDKEATTKETTNKEDTNKRAAGGSSASD